jgi:hypothetical protein
MIGGGKTLLSAACHCPNAPYDVAPRQLAKTRFRANNKQRCSGPAGCGRVGFMKVNRATPPVSVVPVLSYPDVQAAVAWLSAAFGFVERTRIGDSHRAQMSIGADGAVIVAELHGEKSDHKGPVTHLIRVRVENVSAQFEGARAQGAHVVEAPHGPRVRRA